MCINIETSILLFIRSKVYGIYCLLQILRLFFDTFVVHLRDFFPSTLSTWTLPGYTTNEVSSSFPFFSCPLSGNYHTSILYTVKQVFCLSLNHELHIRHEFPRDNYCPSIPVLRRSCMKRYSPGEIDKFGHSPRDSTCEIIQ